MDSAVMEFFEQQKDCRPWHKIEIVYRSAGGEEEPGMLCKYHESDVPGKLK